ncbi:MAG: CoA-binding protein [Deltaproteobacteria bacterium]|nr:CoA-binding protein [Deltaproteobacteria bacterium]
MSEADLFEKFFQSKSFAVVGAAKNRDKYGNKVLRCYMQHDLEVYPVNLRAGEIEGLTCFATVQNLPDGVQSISVITPPPVTEQIVRDAIARGIKNIWMQPGAESPLAIEQCREGGVNYSADGSCVLVHLGFDNSWTPT